MKPLTSLPQIQSRGAPVPGAPQVDSAFTLLELVLTVAMAALLVSVTLLAADDNRAATRSLQCLNNLQQLGRAWLMYADDYQGRLVPNRSGSGTTAAGSSWVGGFMDYSTNPDNTNTTYLVGPATYCGLLGPYIRSASYFRCPSDPSKALNPAGYLPRVRSYSMNNFVGEGAKPLYSSPPTAYQVYPTLASMGRPSPGQLWVILEEHPDSINDGTFFTQPDYAPASLQFVDFPATYHNSACNFVFADGHSAPNRWLDSRTMLPIRLTPPVIVASPNNPDLIWLITHATDRK